MTTFEEEIIRKLIDSNLIKFYARYVDDTLVLAKPSDVPQILEAFHSFHPQIQFTFEEFPDNIVHFLDLQINSSDITIYRKPTHTGLITPKFVRWKNLKSKRHNLRSAYHRKILREIIQYQHKSLRDLKKALQEHKLSIASQTTWFQNIKLKYHAQRPIDKKLLQISRRHEHKFQSLLKEHYLDWY